MVGGGNVGELEVVDVERHQIVARRRDGLEDTDMPCPGRRRCDML